MARKPCEHHISQTHEGNITQFWGMFKPQLGKKSKLEVQT